MPSRIERWGESLGIRIPKDVAGRAGLVEGSPVEIEAQNGHIVISRVDRPRYTLEELLVGMTPDGMHEACDWGPDVGAEAVED